MHERASQTGPGLSRQVYPTAAEIAEQLGGKRHAKGYWMALCPAHDDTNPSLQVWDGEDGPAFKCYAGCSDLDVREALIPLGIRVQRASALHPVEDNNNRSRPDNLDSPDDLQSLQCPRREIAERTYHVYRDKDGKPVSRVERIKYSSGKKAFRQQRPAGNGGWLNGLGGIQPPLYNLPKILKAFDSSTLLIHRQPSYKAYNALESRRATGLTS